MKKKRIPIILASASPRRIKLLKSWGLKFSVDASHIKETTKLFKPSFIVRELALRKAEFVAGKYKKAVVIGADTIVVLNGKIVGKPKSKNHSKSILEDLNGSYHKVYTGVAVINTYEQSRESVFDVSTVKMKKLKKEELKLLEGKHMDKAGSYAIQETDDAFVERIVGDYYNVVGMPYYKTKQLLKKFGIILKNQKKVNNG
ncbi:Maf family protein [Elusimicrobiota bacterium]